jgi:hypothetical protein
MTVSFACLKCASGIATADVAKVKANATAINFAIASVPVGPSEPSERRICLGNFDLGQRCRALPSSSAGQMVGEGINGAAITAPF